MMRGRDQKSDVRSQRAGDRGQRTENRSQIGASSSVFAICLLSSDICPLKFDNRQATFSGEKL